MALDDGHVIAFVHIHEDKREIAGETFLDLYIDVLIVGFSHFKETGLIAIATDDTPLGNRIFHAVIVQAAHMGEIEFQLCAILATQRCTLLERVTELGLECPLAVRIGGVGILRCQGVGLVVGKGRQVVDET